MRSRLPATHIPSFSSLARATFKTARRARATLSLFVVAVLLAGGAAAVRGQSALDGFDPKANGFVRVVVFQPDGKILLGGDFTTLFGGSVMRKRIARLNPDGTLDTFFNPDANGQVLSIAVQAADGKILVGGSFEGVNSIGGSSALIRNRIARLNTNGTLDPTFDGDSNGQVLSIALQADGKILAAGSFSGPNSIGGGSGLTRNFLARLKTDGTLDTTFNPNPNELVGVVKVQGNGMILVGGRFSALAPNAGLSVTRNRIARLGGSGKLDNSFDPNANGFSVESLAIQADGKILVGGFFSGLNSIGGNSNLIRNYFARLNPDGRLDTAFDPNPNSLVYSIAVQPDGRILAGGAFNGLNSIGGSSGLTRNRLARLNPDGTLDTNFNPNASETVLSIALQADGKILAGGAFATLAPNGGAAVSRNNIARLETDGRLDRTLDDLTTTGPPFFRIYAAAVQPDGKILIVGDFTSVLGVARNNIARLNTDGTLDLSFDPNANSPVYSIAVLASGRILIGGSFSTLRPNGATVPTNRNRIARLNASGTLDLTPPVFDPNANGSIYALTVQADGSILAGGNFTSIGGQARNRIARLDANGVADAFDPSANSTVLGIAVLPDSRILINGFFTTLAPILQPTTRNRIARLNANGTLDGTLPIFDPNANEVVLSLTVQMDGKILIGGRFTTLSPNGAVTPTTRNRIARLNADGTLDPNLPIFNPNASNGVDPIAVQADGKILIGGSFATLAPNGASPVIRNYIARLNADGTLDVPFNPNANEMVEGITVLPDGKILVGGAFGVIGGQTRSRFARLKNDTAALQNLALTRATFYSLFPRGLIWTRGGSSPQFRRVTFELSTDTVNYTLLGNGTATGRDWTLTGLNFPTGVNFYVRARGYHHGSGYNSSESIAESVRNAFLTPIEAGNISTRFLTATCCAEGAAGSAPLGPTGANVGIGGFIITGSEPKHVLLRAIGPSLAQFGIPNVLADPVLELHGPDPFATITNNNWRDDPVQEAAILASGIPPANDLESAIDATLAPGSYTAVLRGQNGPGGVALVEAYDLDQGFPSKLANISTRAFVGTGDNIVIAGFILGRGGDGEGDGRIVVRGIGPSLTALGVPDALADPTVELRDSNGTLLVTNNDWQDNLAQAAELTAAGLAPTNPFESGIAMILPPGSYTALLAGLNNSTGVGLVEVYDLGVP